MLESKHILTSKMFISAAVGLISSIAMPALRSYGYDVVITPEMQLNGSAVIFMAIMSFRVLPTKPVHIVKQKVRSSDIAKDRKIIDRGNEDER